eukprot:462697_1
MSQNWIQTLKRAKGAPQHTQDTVFGFSRKSIDIQIPIMINYLCVSYYYLYETLKTCNWKKGRINTNDVIIINRNDNNSSTSNHSRQDTYAPPGFRMIISGFDNNTNRDDIHKFARQAGKSVHILEIYNYKELRHAIASYESKSEFEYAIKYLDNAKLNGIRVRCYDERGPTPPGINNVAKCYHCAFDSLSLRACCSMYENCISYIKSKETNVLKQDDMVNYVRRAHGICPVVVDFNDSKNGYIVEWKFNIDSTYAVIGLFSLETRNQFCLYQTSNGAISRNALSPLCILSTGCMSGKKMKCGDKLRMIFDTKLKRIEYYVNDSTTADVIININDFVGIKKYSLWTEVHLNGSIKLTDFKTIKQ